MGGGPKNPRPSHGGTVDDPKPQKISQRVWFQAPLTRSGRGPGLILVLDHYAELAESDDNWDSPPLRKWAKEGYAVVQLLIPCNLPDGDEFPLQKALDILKNSPACDFGNGVGLISYMSHLPYYVSETICRAPSLRALISYGSRQISSLTEHDMTLPPQLIHIAGPVLPRRESISFAPDLPLSSLSPTAAITSFRYEQACRDKAWMLPGDEKFCAESAAIAHGRSTAFLRDALGEGGRAGTGLFGDVKEAWQDPCLAQEKSSVRYVEVLD